jgi:hypothetical protein
MGIQSSNVRSLTRQRQVSEEGTMGDLGTIRLGRCFMR